MQSESRRETTLDELRPPRRLTLMNPPAVARAAKRHKNDVAMMRAKLVVIGLWNHWSFQFGWRRVAREFFHMFGIDDQELDEALSIAVTCGWLIVEFDEPMINIYVTESIFVIPHDQPRLPIGPPHLDLVIEEVRVNLRNLHLAFARRVMSNRSIYPGHKLLFIAERASSGLLAKSLTYDCTSLGKALGLVRHTIRDGAKKLLRQFGVAGAKAVDGTIASPVPPELYFDFELNGFESVMAITYRGDDVAIDSPPQALPIGGGWAVSPPERWWTSSFTTASPAIRAT